MWRPLLRPPRHGSLHSCWMVNLSLPPRIAQSLVRGLLLPKDVHTFEDGMDESLGRRLQWHTIAIILNSPFLLRSYINLFYPIHVYSIICYNFSLFVFVFIAADFSGYPIDPHPRWAGEEAC